MQVDEYKKGVEGFYFFYDKRSVSEGQKCALMLKMALPLHQKGHRNDDNSAHIHSQVNEIDYLNYYWSFTLH